MQQPQRHPQHQQHTEDLSISKGRAALTPLMSIPMVATYLPVHQHLPRSTLSLQQPGIPLAINIEAPETMKLIQTAQCQI